jgi:GNAT superfamily N-acetyltransferase
VSTVRALPQELTTAFPSDHAAFGPTYSSVLQNPSARLLVAEQDGHIVGYLLGYPHSTFRAGAEAWRVEELCVSPAHHRTSLGRALMGAFEEQARAHGAKLVCLITGKAVEFYRAIDTSSAPSIFAKRSSAAPYRSDPSAPCHPSRDETTRSRAVRSDHPRWVRRA